MARATKEELDMKAAELARAAVLQVRPESWVHPDDVPELAAALDRICRRLLRDSVGNDKILLRQLNKESARQVRPTGKLAKQIERLTRKTGGEKP